MWQTMIEICGRPWLNHLVTYHVNYARILLNYTELIQNVYINMYINMYIITYNGVFPCFFSNAILDYQRYQRHPFGAIPLGYRFKISNTLSQEVRMSELPTVRPAALLPFPLVYLWFAEFPRTSQNPKTAFIQHRIVLHHLYYSYYVNILISPRWQVTLR